ncbi:MAG TPA: FIST N-terminal domain-containing protein, partial [Solirubrobacteraceae bacterium]|nr:FIST N-terminal domain-containing protein [Solirubrobacteraceae bacterium]
IHEVLDPEAVIGCGASGVVAGGREIEDGTALTVWAASLPDSLVTPFHAEVEPLDEQRAALVGMPDLAGASAALMLPDPYTFPTDQLLAQLAEHVRGVPVIGGLSSARTFVGRGALFLGEEVHEAGAVGVRLDGVELLPCVSQGASPVGPELTVTEADGHVILELAGQPALPKLREVLAELPSSDRERVSAAPLLGIVVGPARPDYGQGDFLVRALLDADPDSGGVSVGVPVSEGQVVRLHKRDAPSADRDLRDSLALRRIALGEGAAAGALMFTCNGRGRAMFAERDHDVRLVERELPGACAAGFFAAGEIGPVGGESFLHGFTATVAVFANGG